jgi:hypothetical protein
MCCLYTNGKKDICDGGAFAGDAVQKVTIQFEALNDKLDKRQ